MHAYPGFPEPKAGFLGFVRRNGVVLTAIVGGPLVVGAIAICPRILRHLETADERDARIETVAAHRPVELARCEARATAFYRKLGTYPTLPDGRDAAEVMRNRCARDPTTYR
jgi:hypothetical protein